jgi:hypothetical protein
VHSRRAAAPQAPYRTRSEPVPALLSAGRDAVAPVTPPCASDTSSPVALPSQHPPRIVPGEYSAADAGGASSSSPLQRSPLLGSPVDDFDVGQARWEQEQEEEEEEEEEARGLSPTRGFARHAPSHAQHYLPQPHYPLTGAATGTPPPARRPRYRRMSAPVSDAVAPAVWREDDDSEGGGGAGGSDGGGGASGSDGADTALRRAATLRALRAAAESRRAARISEQLTSSGALDALAQPPSAHHHAHAAPGGEGALPTPAELAGRIGRLDVNLQRYLFSLLTQLEESQAVAAPVLQRVASGNLGGAGSESGSGSGGPYRARHRRVSSGGASAGIAPPPPPMSAAAATAAALAAHTAAFAAASSFGFGGSVSGSGPRFASPPRRTAPADDLDSDEGGPCGGPPPSFDGAGYASPGERDTSASDTPSALPPRALVPRIGGRRAPRFSAAGVAGEAPLAQQFGTRKGVAAAAAAAGSGPSCAFGALAEGGEPSEGDVHARELQESPRPMGASAARLAARRVSHGHPGGLTTALGLNATAAVRATHR